MQIKVLLLVLVLVLVLVSVQMAKQCRLVPFYALPINGRVRGEPTLVGFHAFPCVSRNLETIAGKLDSLSSCSQKNIGFVMIISRQFLKEEKIQRSKVYILN